MEFNLIIKLTKKQSFKLFFKVQNAFWDFAVILNFVKKNTFDHFHHIGHELTGVATAAASAAAAGT